MPLILSGRTVRDARLPDLITRIRSFHRPPTLAIIQVGERPDSISYINAKKALARKIGVAEKHIQLPENISQENLLKAVAEANADAAIDGIIVQLPVSAHLDGVAAVAAIDPEKDADGLTAEQARRRREGESRAILPATARGIKEIFDFYRISLAGTKVAVIGRSALVGQPAAEMCRSLGADVTVCHRGTADLAKETSAADVIICAAGKAGLIGARHVRPGQVVIDVGINSVDGGLAGDVDFQAVAPILGDSGALTPVPGGVGPMTVLGLFENVADLCEYASADKMKNL